MKSEVWWNQPSVLLNFNFIPFKNDNNELINILVKFIILLSILIFIISKNINIIFLVVAFLIFIIVIINIKKRVLKDKSNPKKVLQHNNINHNDMLYQSNLMANRFYITPTNKKSDSYRKYLYQF
jgi:hypothetical protein